MSTLKKYTHTYISIVHACVQQARMHALTHSLSHSVTYSLHSIRWFIALSHHIFFYLFAVVLIPFQLIQLARTPVHRYLSHILFGAMSLHVCTCRDCVLFAPLKLFLLLLLATTSSPLISRFPQNSVIICSLTLSICHNQHVSAFCFALLFTRFYRERSR